MTAGAGAARKVRLAAVALGAGVWGVTFGPAGGLAQAAGTQAAGQEAPETQGGAATAQTAADAATAAEAADAAPAAGDATAAGADPDANAPTAEEREAATMILRGLIGAIAPSGHATATEEPTTAEDVPAVEKSAPGTVQPPALAAGQTAAPAWQDWAAARQTVTLPGGQTLAYVAFGDPAGRPLILLHGYGTSGMAWAPLAAGLDPSRRIIVPDLRGHGGSPDAPDCCAAPADIAADIRGLMDALSLDQADFIGQTLGGQAALMLSVMAPERVGRLVLISTPSYIPTEVVDAMWAALPDGDPAPNADDTAPVDWLAAETAVDQPFLDALAAEAEAISPATTRQLVEGASVFDAMQIATRVTVPVMMLGGESDMLTPAAGSVLETMLPHATSLTRPDAGHHPEWDAPGWVASAVQTFLYP